MGGMPNQVAGVKRKTPTTSYSGPMHPPSTTVATPNLAANPSNPPASSITKTEPKDPGPQAWPNTIGPRPTLTGGLGGFNLMLCKIVASFLSLALS